MPLCAADVHSLRRVDNRADACQPGHDPASHACLLAVDVDQIKARAPDQPARGQDRTERPQDLAQREGCDLAACGAERLGGTFQAVGQRAADAWIDVQGMEVALWSAAWRVSEGLDADRAIQIARWQCAEGSHRVLAAAQHLHGGMGYDKDYPLYRYTLTAACWEHVLGGPGARLERIGALL